MTTTEKDYKVKRDGTLVVRATDQTIGRVWLGTDGWYAENLHHIFGPNWTRWAAAREAWEDWQKIVNSPAGKEEQ